MGCVYEGGRVSIPLRKFPRLDHPSNTRMSAGCFHSTKEVSKASSCSSGLSVALVSIPLRKFPRVPMSKIADVIEVCFHSTKEVSKEQKRRAPLRQKKSFHSTKEVSKECFCDRKKQQKKSFHSTKEVSKVRYAPHALCVPSVSIPLRKFPRRSGVSQIPSSHLDNMKCPAIAVTWIYP